MRGAWRRRGVAYVSYNAYPGWHLRGMIRDMTYYHASQFSDRKVRVQQARNLLEFLAKSATAETTPYSLLLRNELQIFQRTPDSYVCHEHLEEVNEPLYFHQFAERAAAKGLQYLGEADLCAMAPANFPPEVQEVLRMLAADVIHLEQYMDFLRNRTFRQTLLCHEDLRFSRRLRVEEMAKFYAPRLPSRSSRRPDIVSAIPSNSVRPVGWHRRQPPAFQGGDAASGGDLAALRERGRLAAARPPATGGHAGMTPTKTEDLQVLGQCLLAAYTAASRSGIVDLRLSMPRYAFAASERPIGSPVAQVAGRRGQSRHQSSPRIAHAGRAGAANPAALGRHAGGGPSWSKCSGHWLSGAN